MASLRADDGSELKVKEGVVLDRDDRPVQGAAAVFSRMPWLWAGVFAFAVPLVLVAGFALVGGIFALGTAYWFLRALFGPAAGAGKTDRAS